MIDHFAAAVPAWCRVERNEILDHRHRAVGTPLKPGRRASGRVLAQDGIAGCMRAMRGLVAGHSTIRLSYSTSRSALPLPASRLTHAGGRRATLRPPDQWFSGSVVSCPEARPLWGRSRGAEAQVAAAAGGAAAAATRSADEASAAAPATAADDPAGAPVRAERVAHGTGRIRRTVPIPRPLRDVA